MRYVLKMSSDPEKSANFLKPDARRVSGDLNRYSRDDAGRMD
jgi:hypothetical protein